MIVGYKIWPDRIPTNYGMQLSFSSYLKTSAPGNVNDATHMVWETKLADAGTLRRREVNSVDRII